MSKQLFSTRKFFLATLLLAFCSQFLASDVPVERLLATSYSDIASVFGGFSADPSSTSTELNADVTLVTGSAEAIVYCGAFASASATKNKPASNSDIYKQGFYAYTNKRLASVRMTGLIPATLYNIYCMTVSVTDASQMPYSVTLTHNTLGLTNCCKVATFTSTISSLYTLASTVSNTKALYMSLSAAPSTNVTFSLTLASTTGNTVGNLGSLSKTSLTFSSTYTPNTPVPVVLVGGVPDTYSITAAMVSGAVQEYNLVTAGSTTITVLSTTAEPNAPILSSAVFSSDGTYVTVSFDSPTNQGGYANSFSCGALLSFDGSSSATCSWADSSHITIYPAYSDSATVLGLASKINVNFKTIMAFCTDTPAACAKWTHYTDSETKVSVTASSSAVAPTVVVSGPASVGRCSPIVLDWSNSVGNAGRPWASVAFTVSDPVFNPNITFVSNFLASTAYTVSPPAPIPQAYLVAGHTYTFTGVFTNFLGASGTASKAVSVSSVSATPIVSIAGLNTITQYTWNTLLVNAAAYTQNCDGSVSVADLTYTWTLYQTGVTDTVVAVTSASQNPAAFKLAPYTLAVGNTYRVQVSVKTSTSDSVTASVMVVVNPSNLVAVISGGSSRSLQVGSTTYTIDASSSYDQDKQSLTGLAAGLTYTWTCWQTSPSYSTTCPVTLTQGTTSAQRVVSTASSTVGAVARVTVTVSDATRTTSTYMDIKLTLQPSSVITVGSSLSSLTSVNVNQQITLTGTLSLVSACTATWAVDDSSLNLGNIALTPISTGFSTLQPASNTMALLIPGGSLPQRATLGFTLSCGSVSSTFSFSTNGSPLPGLFTASPTTGTELTQTFTFTASRWTDPDLPLSYQFGFISPSTGALLTFRGKAAASYAGTKLPAGASTANNAVFTTLLVYDVYGAASSVEGNVTVTAAASASAQAAGITSLIAASSGSVDDTNSVIATVGVVLNNVDCSGTPNCASLHRQECSTVAHTCGICQAGYLGVANSDNSACMTLDEYKNSQTRRLTVGATCTSNSGCNAGNWETCQSGKCVQASKTCPNSCNSKGTCTYSLISTGEVQDSCGLSDVTCQALCVCNAGYAGSSCSFTSEDMATRQALRAQLIQSLENVTKIDDINEQSIISWANSLSSLALNADELTVAEAAIVHNIVTLTIENAASLGTTDYASLLGLLTSLDSAGTVYVTEDRRRRLSGEDRRLTTAGAMDVLKTAGSFADVISNGMGLDQPPTVNILGNFRMTTQITTSSAGDSIDVQGPQSDLEYWSGSDTPYISMTAGSSGKAVKNSMVLANANTYASILSSLNSNPMQIRIGAGSGLTKFVYMTYNNVPNPLLMDSYVNPVFVLRCNTLKHTQTFTCPDGTVLTQHCIGYAGNYSLACPAPAPQCSVLDTTTLGLSKGTGCKVIDKPYSPYYTTCECTLNPSGNRRLSVQDVLGETGITNMVTTSTYIATQFTSTFAASKDFTTPGDAQKVLIVILMFAILWASGGLAFCVLFMARWKRIQKTNIERRRSTKAGSATHTTADIKRYLLNYVDKLIPDVYHSAKGKMERAMEETRKHHRYLQLFTAKDDQIDVNKRIITLTKMLTIQTMLMFLLAVLYDLQGPDNDGTCVNHDSKSACLQRKSILDSTQTYCQWKVDPKVGWDTCTYNPPNFSVKIMIYIIILTSIFTSICNTPIDMLFDMLEAPTEQTVGVSRLVKATQAVAAGARRASVAGMQIAKAAVANVKQLTWYQKVTGKKEGEEEVLAHRRIPDDVHFAHTMAYMALPEITAQAQVSHLQQTVASNEVRAVAAKRMTQIRGSDRKSGKEETRGVEAVAIAEPLKKDIDRSMDQLLEEIMQQRLILPAESEETTEFDKQWGIEKSISTDARTVSTSLFVNSESLKGISKDVTGSEEKCKDLKKKMENFSDNQAGLDILHFFMVDLLGRHTLAAKIFENKFEEDFERTDVVSKPMKWLVVAAIFGVNAFFMYYSLLKGFSKGIHWQNQYLIGCISQLFIEIFLFESLECVWINYWVPDLVSSEVMRAGTVLKAAAEKISLADRNDMRESAETSKYFLDAPSYLFVSTKLAKAFPKLLESIIVSSYRNHLPGEIARTWRNERSQGKGYKVETELAIKKTFGGSMMGTMVFSCILSLTTVVVVCLQALGSLPYFYQRIIIRFVQPVLLSGLTLLWYFAVHNPIYFAIIGSVVLILGMVLYYRYRNRVVSAKLAKVQPTSSSSRRSDKVRDMGEAKVNEMVPVSSLNGPVGGGSNKAGSVPSSEEGVAAVTPSNAMKRILANVMEESSSEDSMSI